MDELRHSGFVLILGTEYGPRLDLDPYFSKPRLFLHGNLGAQYSVRTVGGYLFGQAYKACNEAGMDYRGRFVNWPRAKFLLASRKEPTVERLEWESGIGPNSVAELAEKTYIGAVIVEAAWEEPMSFFRQSTEWKLLDENQWAAVFVRNIK